MCGSWGCSVSEVGEKESPYFTVRTSEAEGRCSEVELHMLDVHMSNSKNINV